MRPKNFSGDQFCLVAFAFSLLQFCNRNFRVFFCCLFGVAIVAFFFLSTNGSSVVSNPLVANLAGTLVSKKDREIEIGGKSYRFSEKLQDYLIIKDKSNYPSRKSVLIVQEPHSNLIAQKNLYKGLEFFFSENPELARHATFLAEGVEEEKVLDLSPLIEIEPHPQAKLLGLVLSSYLIPGYVAYEWKHHQNIPIIGLEDWKLYSASANLYAQTGISDLWRLSVVARNKKMAEVSIKTLQHSNPILFVVGAHLYAKDSILYKQFLSRSTSSLAPALIQYLKAGANLGIKDYLQKAGIGYIYLEPTFYLRYYENEKYEVQNYQDLFKAQILNDYKKYIAKFVSSHKVSINFKNNAGVTVSPNLKAAAHLLSNLKSSNSDKGAASSASSKSSSIKSLLKAAKLPTTGKIRFIPRDSDKKSGSLLRKLGGYMDKFDNIWIKASTRTGAEEFDHWDVQLSDKGKRKMVPGFKLGNHVNVTLDGKLVK